MQFPYVLDEVCRNPERPISTPIGMPIFGLYKTKGIGEALAGRVEQGVAKTDEEMIFLSTHISPNPGDDKVFTDEVHGSRVDNVDEVRGGSPCGGTSEAMSCNVQPCGKHCMVSDWAPWSACSKICGPSHRWHGEYGAMLARALEWEERAGAARLSSQHEGPGAA